MYAQLNFMCKFHFLSVSLLVIFGSSTNDIANLKLIKKGWKERGRKKPQECISGSMVKDRDLDNINEIWLVGGA